MEQIRYLLEVDEFGVGFPFTQKRMRATAESTQKLDEPFCVPHLGSELDSRTLPLYKWSHRSATRKHEGDRRNPKTTLSRVEAT